MAKFGDNRPNDLRDQVVKNKKKEINYCSKIEWLGRPAELEQAVVISSLVKLTWEIC